MGRYLATVELVIENPDGDLADTTLGRAASLSESVAENATGGEVQAAEVVAVEREEVDDGDE